MIKTASVGFLHKRGRPVSPIQTSEQITEKLKMSMENVESQVVQNAEQGPLTSQHTVNDPSGKLELLIDR
jgi:hypothetical protein